MDILVKLSDAHQGRTKEEISMILDVEVERFSKYMSELGDWKAVGPLATFEKALIKTYLIQKLKGTLDQEE